MRCPIAYVCVTPLSQANDTLVNISFFFMLFFFSSTGLVGGWACGGTMSNFLSFFSSSECRLLFHCKAGCCRGTGMALFSLIAILLSRQCQLVRLSEISKILIVASQHIRTPSAPPGLM